MSQIIELNVSKIKGESLATPVSYGFDVEDICGPITYNSSSGKSLLDARKLNGGQPDGRSLGRTAYEVNHTLAQIAGKSYFLFVATVIAKKGIVKTTPEQMVFNSVRVSETLIPTLSGGCKFFYNEDGDPNSVEYEVSESVANIVAQLTITLTANVNVRNGLDYSSGYVELGGALIHNTTIDLDGFNLSFSNVPAGSGSDDALVIDSFGNIGYYSLSYLAGWGLTGNAGTIAGTNYIGTSDNIDVVFGRNGIEKLKVLTSSVTIVDNVGIGGPNIEARLHVKGLGGEIYAFKVENSTATGLFNITNAGKINVGGGAAIGSTFSVRQNGGTRAFDVYNTAADKQLILAEDDGASTGFVRIADGTLEANTYTHNVGIGVTPGISKLRVKGDSAGQDVFNITPSAGSGGVLIADASNHPFLYMQDATAGTKVQLNTNGDSFFNGGKMSMTALPTSNAGLSTGDFYVDTAANILSNGDKVVGWKV